MKILMTAAAALGLAPLSQAATFSGSFLQPGGAVYSSDLIDTGFSVVIDTISPQGPHLYVAGRHGTPGVPGNWLVIKYNSAGIKTHAHSIESATSSIATSALVEPEGRLLVAGGLNSTVHKYSFHLRRYNSSLVTIASTTLAWAGEAHGLARDQSGHIYAAAAIGSSPSDAALLLLKFNPDLTLLSSATFRGRTHPVPSAIVLDGQGSLYITGETIGEPGGYHILALKFDANLAFLTSATFNGSSGLTDRAWGIARHPNGNIYVVGETHTPSASAIDLLMLKYSPALVLLASATYNGPADQYDWARAITVHPSGDLLITGMTATHSNWDYLTARYDPHLRLISSKNYDGGGSDQAHALALEPGAYVYVTGESGNPTLDIRTLRYNLEEFGLPGIRWTPQRLSQLGSFYDVDFVDSSTGWVVGSVSARTRDGGATWLPMRLGIAGLTLHGVDFLDQNLGWAAGERQQDAPIGGKLIHGVILHTRDGGESWEVQKEVFGERFWRVSFVDDRTGWAASWGGTIYQTRNGGRTWRRLAEHLPILLDLRMADRRTGWASGHEFWYPKGASAHYRSVLLRTDDGGRRWQAIYQSEVSSTTQRYLAGVTFMSPSTGWAVGSEGAVLKTVNSTTWIPQASGTMQGLADITLNGNAGWIVGNKGIILHTEDGGETWAAERSGTDKDLRGVVSVDEINAWAVGLNGAILRRQRSR